MLNPKADTLESFGNFPIFMVVELILGLLVLVP